MDLRKELILATDDANESKMLSRLLEKGRVRKLAPKVYTTNLIDSPESIIRRNLMELLAWRLPGCVISYRSAQSMRPTEKGNIYITYSFTKRIESYPGVILNVIEGPKPLENDISMGYISLFVASEPRWMLEVLQPARRGKDGDLPSDGEAGRAGEDDPLYFHGSARDQKSGGSVPCFLQRLHNRDTVK